MKEQMLSPGDVLGFPIERIGRFGACQIVAADTSKRQVTVALLDWTGDHMPEPGDLVDAPRLVASFMFWSESEGVQNVSLPPPSRYRVVGQLPVQGTTESNTYCGWNFGDVVMRQQRWNALPAELTKAFKACLDSEQATTIPGLVQAHDGSPMRMCVAAARGFRDDDAGYRITDEFRMASLKAWPALFRVSLQSWRKDLVPFLESAPLVLELSLVEHGQREIDLSRTHLNRLAIDIHGLQRLVLPESMTTLIVLGKGAVNSFGSVDALLDETSAGDSDAIPLTQVVAAQNGRWIWVQANGRVPPIHGINRVHGLSVSKVAELDLWDVVNTFPNIEYLHLFGAPGTLGELAALTELPKLEALRISDLFGYLPEDFPAPGELPALTSLTMDSVPADVAAAVRKGCKKTPHIALSVRKPRAPEWLQENLENPLRHWDGREGIPAAVVKKTRAAFLNALRQVREANNIADAEDATYTETVARAVSEFLEVVGALNRKHEFLYTLERDEVLDAVDMLAAKLSESARAALDPFLEAALDD
ncbi:hypothetical protein [Variovorax paradoxus]|uniref:hypothetical protein n=1 Tax=Variovorax paradoxus TaxID=34073 RepID=UPI003D652463